MTKTFARLQRNTGFLRALMLLVVCFIGRGLHAQVAGTGTIQGTITDSTGALIPNAVITITETSTQVTRTSKTDSSGSYVFPNIVIGTYNVAITVPGFEKYVKTGNVLEVGSKHCRQCGADDRSDGSDGGSASRRFSASDRGRFIQADH